MEKEGGKDMRYKTHLVTSFAVVAPVAIMTNNVDIMGACGLALGAILPDIDEPGSYVGRRIPLIPHILKRVFGHRGMTHTLLATMLFVLLAIIIPNSFTCMLAIGYFLHILEDTFSVSGIKWFAPFNSKVLAFKWYSTGKSSESIIFIYMCAVICLESFLWL
ncbi:metal-dependent hydrolase [Listeria seeligeri]